MKNAKRIIRMNLPFSKGIAIAMSIMTLIIISFSCNEEACGYDKSSDNPAGCILSNSLKLSTGIDSEGNVIAPGDGVTDPFWKLINKPPLVSCSSPLAGTINGSAYIVNYFNSDTVGWVNLPGSSTLAPVDLGTTNSFGCNNPFNADNEIVPYIFERSFCVLKDTRIDLNFKFKGDDEVRFELIDNITGNILNASLNYVFYTTPETWSASSLPIAAGSYSVRAYLVNVVNVVLGFSIVGNLTTTDGDLAISNNASGCCENNTLSILNVLDSNCDAIFNGSDEIGNGWTFNLLDASSNIIRSAITDINGNIFFSGLPNGTYTVVIVPQGGWTPVVPANGSVTINIANNTVNIIEFYNCK